MLNSEDLATWADQACWELIEGRYKHDHTREAKFLQEIMSDITAQWESLVANHRQSHEAGKPSDSAEFPQDWILEWSTQVQQALL